MRPPAEIFPAPESLFSPPEVPFAKKRFPRFFQTDAGGPKSEDMRNETTTLRRPKTWVTIALALGHAAIIAGLAISALSPRTETEPKPENPGMSILDCAHGDEPSPLR